MDLLLSLMSADELRLASDYSFRWLDLKNPLAGSLGCPDASVASDFLEVAERLQNRSQLTISVAIGELLSSATKIDFDSVDTFEQFQLPLPVEVLDRFDYIKVALAGSRTIESWKVLAESLSRQLSDPSKIILVHYADYQLANAIDWKSTLAASRNLGCEYVLIDTFDKKAGQLLNWLSIEDCQRYATKAESLGLKLSLAGSLRIEDFKTLEKTGASILGIRGAACLEGSRVSMLCRDRLQKLSSCFAIGKLATELG
jgi:uncharacterized protein (UPF0264 family)